MTILRPTSSELGSVIRDLRRERKMTVKDLASASETHPSYLSGIEQGTRNPTWGKLVDMAYSLDTPLSSIVRDVEAVARLSARLQLVRSKLGLDELADS
jgi:transcriptional regulator with XRE-family HTH domain